MDKGGSKPSAGTSFTTTLGGIVTIKKWGSQLFLNPPGSNDDGWAKFSIRPTPLKDYVGFTSAFIISDCSNKAYLEFDPGQWSISKLQSDDRTDKKEAVATVNEKLKKVRAFRRAIVIALDKFEEALEETKAQIESLD